MSGFDEERLAKPFWTLSPGKKGKGEGPASLIEVRTKVAKGGGFEFWIDCSDWAGSSGAICGTVEDAVDVLRRALHRSMRQPTPL